VKFSLERVMSPESISSGAAALPARGRSDRGRRRPDRPRLHEGRHSPVRGLILLLVPEQSTRLAMVRIGEAAIASIGPEAAKEARAGGMKIVRFRA